MIRNIIDNSELSVYCTHCYSTQKYELLFVTYADEFKMAGNYKCPRCNVVKDLEINLKIMTMAEIHKFYE